LATCADGREPWALTADDVVFAIETAKRVQESAQLADCVFAVINDILDPNHLTDRGPLAPALTRERRSRGRRARFAKSAGELRSDLEARKRDEKLPDRRAFWELVRIVFTETPKSFLDLLRFAQAKVLLLTGLRVGEVARLPADWKRFRHFYDAKGRPAGELGGYSRSLMLRHFAEKRRNMNAETMALFESTQHVPALFEEILASTLDNVVDVTAPLRRTLRRQVETGRILPDFEKTDLVRAIELYVYLTGNPFTSERLQDNQRHYKDRYQVDYRPEILDELRHAEVAEAELGYGRLNRAVYMYLNRLHGVPFRDNGGSLWRGPKSWNSIYLRVGEVEDFIAAELDSKLSDTIPIPLSVGHLSAWELMFLMPKRALPDGRDEGICDITRYFAVGRMDASMMVAWLSSSANVFSTYACTDEDRRLALNSHSLRHLQNTELFRLGVADTIITKRFNRRSVAQTYDYDHRSLAEELNQVELSPEIELRLGEKASTVARMMKAGKARGPIVEAFVRIQREQGQDAALEYLRVEADGFHSTPYGHCVNSFTVDPCPKHLECFNGCRHLLATDLPGNRRSLVQLESRLQVTVQAIEARNSSNIGRENQLKHARTCLVAVQKILSTPPGKQVFPDGKDLSRTKTSKSVLDDD
jgi:hypothetical protein